MFSCNFFSSFLRREAPSGLSKNRRTWGHGPLKLPLGQMGKSTDAMGGLASERLRTMEGGRGSNSCHSGAYVLID